MNDFFKLMSPAEFIALFDDFAPLATESIALHQARGRILAEQLISREALPPFSLSTIDA